MFMFQFGKWDQLALILYSDVSLHSREGMEVMPVVTVEYELYRRVEEAAQENKATVDEILAEAVRSYLWEQDRRKIEKESETYRRQYGQLKDHYLGHYIAMLEGQVVDHDPDFTVLRQRIRQQYGHTPVMIILVEDQSIHPLSRRGFRQENGLP
jgi:hypothetical protein